MSAYPVMASGYLFFPFGPKVNLYLRAGAGFVFAKFVGREGLKKPEETRFFYTIFETATARQAAVLGGLGLSYNFDPAFGFFIEAAARSGKVAGFAGEDSLQQAGRLYAYEEFIPDLGFWQAKVHVLPEAPAGGNFRTGPRRVGRPERLFGESGPGPQVLNDRSTGEDMSEEIFQSPRKRGRIAVFAVGPRVQLPGHPGSRRSGPDRRRDRICFQRRGQRGRTCYRPGTRARNHVPQPQALPQPGGV